MNSSVGEEGKQGGVIAHETRYQRAEFGYHCNIPRETNESLYMSAVKMHVDKNLRSDALQCHSSNLHRVT